MFLISLLLIIASFLVKDGSGLWCFQCSELLDNQIKCPKTCDYIEKWKNCPCRNHTIESEFENNYCIVGMVQKTIMIQVSRYFKK